MKLMEIGHMRKLSLTLGVLFLCQSLIAKDIVVGIEPLPVQKMAFLFTPVVIPDLISAKAAFEYRLYRKFNLVLPIEAKWMDYRAAIKLGSKLFKQRSDVPEYWYRPEQMVKIGYNIDIAHFKLSSGLGLKWFPFSEAMTNAFFVKTSFLVGYEKFNAFTVEGKQDSAVLTHVVTIGYNWVKRRSFTFGFEVGEEYVWHTNGIKGMPILIIDGLIPILQFSLGFTI
jgi:hypothetical protein